MKTSMKIRKIRTNVAARKAGQRLEYSPSGAKYTPLKVVGRVRV